MENAEVIIIGAGIIGCALFHELSKASTGKIILLEKSQIASGTTGESGGFIRKINCDPYLADLASDSFAYYQNFAGEVGLSCGFTRTGLQYTVSQQMLKEMRSIIGTLHHDNYPIYCNHVSSDLALVHELNAGFIDTRLTCKAWVQKAREHNGLYYEHRTAKEILIRGNCVYGVDTNTGIIASKNIVITAGHSSRSLLLPLGIDLPLSIKSFQYHIYPQAASYLESAQINMLDDFYVFPIKNNRMLAGFLSQDKLVDNLQVPQDFDKSLSNSLHQKLSDKFPWIKNRVYTVHKSYDAYTPDNHGLLQELSGSGLFIASGLSSGGIKIAPALAQKLMQQIKVPYECL